MCYIFCVCFRWPALKQHEKTQLTVIGPYSFPVAQIVEHGASNAKIMGSIPRESKNW